MVYTSKENTKIKELKKLNQKKYRDNSEVFLVEGPHLVEEAYKARLLEEVILLDGIEYETDIPITYVSEYIMSYLTDLDTPSNMMGIVRKKTSHEIGNRVLLIDDIKDPGNLGTIIRSAAAFNVNTIILSENTVDLYNSKVLRATQGMLFYVNIFESNLKDMVRILKGMDYYIIGTKVDVGTDLKTVAKKDKTAIILGNEGKGMSEELANLTDTNVLIKTNKNTESLNVAIAGSIILYELDK